MTAVPSLIGSIGFLAAAAVFATQTDEIISCPTEATRWLGEN